MSEANDQLKVWALGTDVTEGPAIEITGASSLSEAVDRQHAADTYGNGR